jgi:hypothetical protein
MRDTMQRLSARPHHVGSPYDNDGDVTAPLVYVNFGIPKDYETLDRLGVSVKGAIVIARYGGSWRGIKPKVAAEHGAVGCIIYSDPHEDGYFNDDVFPKGSGLTTTYHFIVLPAIRTLTKRPDFGKIGRSCPDIHLRES